MRWGAPGLAALAAALTAAGCGGDDSGRDRFAGRAEEYRARAERLETEGDAGEALAEAVSDLSGQDGIRRG